MPFIKILDSQSCAVSQGGTRGGAMATYLHISHPEIEEFIDLRRPIGDQNRRSLNIHHGVVINDAFMKAVENGEKWELKSPVDSKPLQTVNARDLWIKILTARVETGEPYIVFENHANDVEKGYPEIFKALNLKIEQSNLCSEIMLPTHRDYNNNKRTAICCLSSLNLEKYLEWENDKIFIKDILYFLDNVLEDYIKKAPQDLKNAIYSVVQSRTIGLGVMGFHSFLQSQMVAFEGVMAKSWNKRIFKYIKNTCDEFNIEIANERGEPKDVIYAREKGLYNGKKTRFITMLAIAPTASISNICGESSPGIEPYAANVFTQKTKSGSFVVKNKNLKKLLQQKHKDTQEVWSSIATNDGSVQHLDFLSYEEKAVFKTSFEINQAWIIEHVADRTPFICQSQSVNLFFFGNVAKSTLHTIHFDAWKKGVKSLYYCRSRSIQRADKVSDFSNKKINLQNKTQNEEECLACQ
jgi:ribonucleoside-diphosphate reductase alpha chain